MSPSTTQQISTAPSMLFDVQFSPLRKMGSLSSRSINTHVDHLIDRGVSVSDLWLLRPALIQEFCRDLSGVRQDAKKFIIYESILPQKPQGASFAALRTPP